MPGSGFKSLTIKEEIYSELCKQAVNYGITPQILISWLVGDSSKVDSGIANNKILGGTGGRTTHPPSLVKIEMRIISFTPQGIVFYEACLQLLTVR
jgi:hypothetical protein